MACFKEEPRATGGSTGGDELTRAVREGVRPEGMKERLKLAVDKLAGNAPMGIDAPNKGKDLGSGLQSCEL